MRSLFLTSMFEPMAHCFREFEGGSCQGKTACIIPTASSQQKIKHFLNADKKALEALGIALTELEVSTADRAEIETTIQHSDYVVVEGGNTFYLLQELRRSGADQMILEHIALGKTYVGVSAGSVILSPNIDYIAAMDSTDAAPELHGDFRALSVLDYYVLPHVGNFPFKTAVKAIQQEYGSRYDLHAISNQEAISIHGAREQFVHA